MNHYMDFDPYVIGERNQQVYREVRALRLKEQLREERGSSGSRLVALAKRGVRPLLLERRAGCVLANEKGGQAHGEEDSSCAKASRARIMMSTQPAISKKEEA